MIKFIDLKNYECNGIIGEGSFGKVYRVTETSDGKNLVAKVVNKEMKEEESNQEEFIDFYREIKLLSSFNHPSILRFIGYSTSDFEGNFHPTIITEYAPNGTLRDILDEEIMGLSKPGWNMTKKLINIYGIANGMKYLHSHSILHRDLKSNNILLDDNLYPLISDFGLSKITEGCSESLIYQSIANLKGTPNYCSPEYLTSLIFTQASDVYAFGLIVYEIMSGLVPFSNAKNLIDLFNIICKKCYRPELTPEIPQAYKNLIERCWSQNPEERPSFSEIVSELEDYECGFIIDTIDEPEFEEYCEFLNEHKSTFELDNSVHFNNFLQNKNSPPKSNQNFNIRKSTLRRKTIYNAPNLDQPNSTIIDKANVQPIKDDEKLNKIESSQKNSTKSKTDGQVLDSNKKGSTPKEKPTKNHWLIQKNKKKSTPIESQQETNIQKPDLYTISTKGDPSNPIKIGLLGGGSGCGKT